MSHETDTPGDHGRVALFQTGDFTLASGQRSTWKIECDALTADDWSGLAAMLVALNPRLSFRRAFGVPRGGLPFADALSKHADPDALPVLVVDDVWTTGGSMQRYIEHQFTGWFAPPTIVRAVAFARNQPDDGVIALLHIGGPTDG